MSSEKIVIVVVSGCVRDPPAQQQASCIKAEQAGWRERVDWWSLSPGSIRITILTLEPYKSLAEAQEYPDGMARSEGWAGDIRWNIDGPPKVGGTRLHVCVGHDESVGAISSPAMAMMLPYTILQAPVRLLRLCQPSSPYSCSTPIPSLAS